MLNFVKLRAHLHALPDGPVEEPGYVLTLLGYAWPMFEGVPVDPDHRDALLAKARDLRWASPVLSFSIGEERITTREGKQVEAKVWSFDLSTAKASASVQRWPYVKPERKRRAA